MALVCCNRYAPPTLEASVAIWGRDLRASQGSDRLHWLRLAEHPNAKIARNLLEKSQARTHVLKRPTKIFLGQNSKNKKLVRYFKSTLNSVKYWPWLDADALKAGAKLERGLLHGMNELCAAVSFITPHFVDDEVLTTEIDHAISPMRERGPDFLIITLILKGDDGVIGELPPLLKRFVWNPPRNSLEMFTIIVEGQRLDQTVAGRRTDQ
jgi:hypothetical protein